MNQDPFIDQLANGLPKAPQRLPTPRAVGLMLLMSAVAGLILLGFCGTRADLVQAWDRSTYRWEFAAMLLFVVIAYGLAEQSSIPGAWRHPSRWLLLTALPVLSFAALILRHPHFDQAEPFLAGAPCLLLIALCSSGPLFYCVRRLRRGAPTRPRLTLALALGGSLGAAIAVQHLLCGNEDPWHLLGWHLGILPLSLVAAGLWGRRILRW